MFIKTTSFVYYTTHISFTETGMIQFIAEHDNDTRLLPISEIICISKIHPDA